MSSQANAGRISINLDAPSAQFVADLDRANAKLREFGQTLLAVQAAKQSGSAVSASLAQISANNGQLQQTSKSLDGLKTALDGVGNSAKGNAPLIASHVGKAAEAVGALVATKVGLVELSGALLKVTSTSGGQAASFSTVAESATNAYRVIRLALSPTLFTGASLAAGILLEKLASITNEEGKQLELQSRIAAQRGLQPADVSAISLAAGKGQKASDFLDLAKTAANAKEQVSQSLGVSLSGKAADDLRAIARALNDIKDPFDKATAAQKVFGDQANKALDLLDGRFAENSQRVRDWGLVYSVETRANILAFRQDLEGLSHPFRALGDIIHATVQQAKGELATFFASVYGQVRSGELQGALLAPFNLDRYSDNVPKQVKGFFAAGASATGGLNAVVQSALRSGGTRTPEEQFTVERQDNLASGSRRATSPLAHDLAIGAADVAAVNQRSAGVEGLRQKLEALQHRRSEIIKTYYELDANGELKFKDDNLSNIQKAGANASLLSANRGISDTSGAIAKAEADKQAASQSATAAAAAARNRAGRFNSLLGEAQQSQIESAAAGQPNGSPYAKAAGETARQIATLNNELARNGHALTLGEKYYIRSIQNTIALNQADKEWKDTVAGISDSLVTQTAAQDQLTDAIGKGADATRAAAIESQLMNALGSRYNEPGRLGEKNALRSRFAADYDAKGRSTSATNVAQLNQEAEATLRLAAAQQAGAEAVRQQAIENEILNMRKRPGFTQQEEDAFRNRAKAEQSSASSGNLAGILQELQATKLLTAAQLSGEDAVRSATLDNQVAAAKRAGATAQEIEGMRSLADAQDRQRTASEAGARLNAASDEVKSLREQLGLLQKIQATDGNTLKVRAAIKSLTLQIAEAENQQVLASGKAADGFQVFFRELTQQGESAAKKVHDVLTGAFEGVNDNLSKLITGQKSDWAGFFLSISQEFARMALLNGETAIAKQLGLGGSSGSAGSSSNSGGGAGGAVAGILGGLFGRGQSAASRSQAAGGTPGFLSDGDAGSSAADDAESSGGGGFASVIGGFFKSLFGGFKAGGGDVDPGKAYVVGENGPEVFSPSGRGSITANNKLGGGGAMYYIDARGANEADVEQRVQRSLVAVHGSAVKSSAAVQAEMAKRRPKGS